MMKLPFHKTKIVCTIGPACRSTRTLERMIKSGMNIARLNFSHGSLNEQRENIRNIYKTAAKLKRMVTIMIDLPGSKIRIGKLQAEPLVLKKGSSVTLTVKDVLGTGSLIPVNYARLTESVTRESVIYLNDGFIELKAEKVFKDGVQCKVIMGGALFSHKGINLPGAKLYVDTVTEKDLELIDFGLHEGVGTFGVSFIQRKEDILKVKEFARKKGKSVNIVAKIERREALNNFHEILTVADAIMIARGDLGVEIPIHDVAVAQKKLIREANIFGCPVITATQMLESMMHNSRPTRAEVTDVANAILDGSDAVMLSEETAIGEYPVEAIDMMVKIAGSIEQQRHAGIFRSFTEGLKKAVRQSEHGVDDVISLNIVETIEALKISYIVSPAVSGNTSRKICRFKPSCWILSFSKYKKTCEILNFSYGIYPFFVGKDSADVHKEILEFIHNSGLFRKGDKTILTERVLTQKPSVTDSLEILTI